jgi:3,4-dihydroxy 2-butanone 4-phosphate synthase/GTP cyclohydrolase II
MSPALTALPALTAPPVPGLATITAALSALRAGRPVLVLDDDDRENEGDVVLAGQTLTASWLAWTIRHTSGYLCAPMPNAWADRLELPPMVSRNQDPRATAYTITCDAAEGITTGISAADRTRTIRVLADPASTPAQLIRPGHVVPLRAREGGVLTRRGHTEACVDLCTLAGLAPVGVIGELVHDEGSMMRTPQVLALGAREDLPVVTIAALVDHRRRTADGTP